MTPIRIGLVDDHALFRKGLIKLITEDPLLEVRVEAASGQELLEKISRQKVDVVFTDISMPQMDGMEVTKWISRDHKSVRVLGLSQFCDLFHIKRIMELGACGYLLKDADLDDLHAAPRAVMKGLRYFCRSTADQLFQATMKILPAEAQLDHRDFQLLQWVYEEKSEEEMALEWGVVPKTIHRNMTDLMEKLGAKSKVGLVKWVIEHGLR